MDRRRYRTRPRTGREISGKISPWLPVGALALIVLGLGYASSRPKGSDADQIVAALNDSIKASKEGRAGGVLEKLADGFSVNSQVVSNGQIADFIKKQRPDVEVTQPTPVVSGDDAHIVSPVKVTLNLLGSEHGMTVKNVDIQFRRETAHAWLIFPVATWRMTRVEVPSDALSGVGSMAGFGDM